MVPPSSLRENVSGYVMLICWWFVTIGFLVDGAFALRSPSRWLRSRWTARRSMGSETPIGTVRFLGLVFLLAGGFLAFEGIRFLPAFLRPAR